MGLSWAKISYANQENTDKLDDLGHPIPKKITIVMEFSELAFGFGEISVIQDEEGLIYLDTEGMGMGGVKYFFERLVNNAILDTEEDPVKHKKYNEVRGRRCSSKCEVCK